MEITSIILINSNFQLVDYMVDISNSLKSQVYQKLHLIIRNLFIYLFNSDYIKYIIHVYIIQEDFYKFNINFSLS